MFYDNRVTFRLTELEKNRIMQQARAEGITTTHLLRCIIEGYLNWLTK
jgi:predicted DNA binding CopG/RHH family protein